MEALAAVLPNVEIKVDFNTNNIFNSNDYNVNVIAYRTHVEDIILQI